MNNIDRHLVELNEILLKMSMGHRVTDEQLDAARKVLSGGVINTGPGNDTVIVNQGSIDGGECKPCPPGYTGSIGYTGSQGDIGYTGSSGGSTEPGYTGSMGYTGSKGDPGICYLPCKITIVSNDYTALSDDQYIGVNSSGPVTITLPENPSDCQQLIIKAEMGPPLGNRKVTIVAGVGSTIDGETSYVMSVPWESVHLYSHDGNWYIV